MREAYYTQYTKGMSQPVRRQSRPPAQEDWGIAVPFFAGAMIIAVIGFWPAMVWHGYTDTGGWRWDIHSTVAEAAYFGVVAFVIGCVILGNRGPRPAAAPPPTKPPAGPPPRPRAKPVCLHRQAVRVESIMNPDETVAYLCPDCDTQLDERGSQP